jgi:proteasome lid subunit RPN8/RPN11
MTTRLQVLLTGPVRAEMAAAATAAAPWETGGLLLGWWEGDQVIVRHAVEVPDRRATTTSWVRRPRVARKIMHAALQQYNHPLLGYVGDWHIHPERCTASRRDVQSITETSRQYDEPLVLLVRMPDGSLDVRAAHRGHCRMATLFADTDGDRSEPRTTREGKR